MGKRAKVDRPIEKSIMLPKSVVEAVDTHLVDPLTDRPGHGAWSRLLTGLLTEWLRQQQKPNYPGTP
jgi:hypothetical protein